MKCHAMHLFYQSCYNNDLFLDKFSLHDLPFLNTRNDTSAWTTGKKDTTISRNKPLSKNAICWETFTTNNYFTENTIQQMKFETNNDPKMLLDNTL